MTNFYLGLARGPIDHNASSVINSISNLKIEMGSAVKLLTTIGSAELLPRVLEVTANDEVAYGVVVGGDFDGVYGDGSLDTGTPLTTVAAAIPGKGVVVVTQGRCLARVRTTNRANAGTQIAIDTPLVAGNPTTGTVGQLIPASNAAETVIARALQPVTTTNTSDIIAVDVQREGRFIV